MSNISFRDRVTATILDTSAATGLGRTKIYELIKQGRIRTTKVGKRTLLNVPSVLNVVEAA